MSDSFGKFNDHVVTENGSCAGRTRALKVRI
jgi:hypothetical protein